MNPPTEQIGAQSDSFITNIPLAAKKLNDAKWIYGLYGALDGLSTSFSMLKYFFDMYYTSHPSHISSSDALRNWSLTPAGIAFLTIESLLFIGCAVIGNTAEDDGYSLHLMSLDEAKQLKYVNCFLWHNGELVYIAADGTETIFNRDGDQINLSLINKLTKDKQTGQRIVLSSKKADGLLLATGVPFVKDTPTPTWVGSIGVYWPYVRDVMKAMKNTYKGIRNTFVLTDLLIGGREYHYLAVPLGLVVGVMAAYNRTWLRKIRAERKTAKKLNIDLLASIKSMSIQDRANESMLDSQYAKIQTPSHSQHFWVYAYLSAAVSGLVDAPYLDFGTLGLTMAAATSFFFIFVATAAFIFVTTRIASRIYEEYNLQREHLVSQLDVELNVLRLKTLALYDKLLTNLNDPALDNEASDNELKARWSECQVLQKKLLEQVQFSLGFILMGGLKNGLDTYGALASLMFLIATINLVIAVPYSQVLLAGFITAGLIALLVFPIMELIKYYSFQEQPKNANTANIGKSKSTLDLYADLELKMEGKITVSPVSQKPRFYDDELEMVRGTCSGAGKGIRSVEQIMSGAQALGADGHYHDTPGMWAFAGISATFFALTFGGRGFARWGRGIKNSPATTSEGNISDNGDQSAKKKLDIVDFSDSKFTVNKLLNDTDSDNSSETEIPAILTLNRVETEGEFFMSRSSSLVSEPDKPSPSPCGVNSLNSSGLLANSVFKSVPDVVVVTPSSSPQIGMRLGFDEDY